MKYTLRDLLHFGTQTVLITITGNKQYRGYFSDHGEDQVSTYFILKPSMEKILVPLSDLLNIELTNP